MVVEVEPPFLLIKPGVSEEEFYRCAGEDSAWEYLDGRLVMSPASDLHEDLFAFLMALFRTWLDEKGGGVVRGSRYPMRLDPRWSPEPDLLVVRNERRHLLKPQRLEGPADLVIEIASEADPEFDVREKLPRYRAAGIPEIWLIDPFSQSLLVQIRGTDGDYTGAIVSSGRLESVILPGLWIDASWLWTRPLPSTFGCLQQMLA